MHPDRAACTNQSFLILRDRRSGVAPASALPRLPVILCPSCNSLEGPEAHDLPTKPAVLGLAGWLTASTVAADDVEVLGRGPVHEAYAEPSEREPKPTPVIAKEPPKPIEELPPDQKPEGDNVQWMAGYWSWDLEKKDFIWVSGFWRKMPPGRTWMPGSWRKVADGWQWTGGLWTEAKNGKARLEYLPKPPAPLDAEGATTPAPSEKHLYVPGSWVYRDDRYVAPA